MHWTKEAIALGARYISSIIEVDSTLQKKGEVTPTPTWVNQPAYELSREKKIRVKLLSIESNMEKLQKEKEDMITLLADETVLKGLLYEKGKPLERAVIEALKMLGFQTSQYKDSESEFDVVFESSEGRLIGEVEGKDNLPINIDKFRQLEMNIHEDYDRDDVSAIAKGVLIGNAYRLTALDSRGDFFTTKCLTATKRTNTALIKSIDLFMVAQYLSTKSDKTYAKKCRKAILNSVGLIVFPKIPERSSLKEEVMIETKDNINT